jgi:hypothetical protein
MTFDQHTIQNSDAIATPVCMTCRTAMRLFGIEDDLIGRELLSFECPECEHIETRTDRCQ